MANYKSDEEYHFSEAETPVSYTTESAQSTKDKDFQGRRKGRNIILMLAILMAFWAVYKFLGIFLSQTKPIPHTNKPAKIATSAQAQSPAHHLTVNSKSQPIQPLRLTGTTLSAEQIQEISEQKTRLGKLESEIVNFQTTLSEANAKLSDLSTQIENLTSRANKPVPAVSIKKPARPLKKHQPSISYSYQLEAAIPGRAWLMRSDGTNITVSLGDKILGYGTVLSIDPNDGVVQTSSGANIKYRSH